MIQNNWRTWKISEKNKKFKIPSEELEKSVSAVVDYKVMSEMLSWSNLLRTLEIKGRYGTLKRNLWIKKMTSDS